MDALVNKLETKLRTRSPEVRPRVAEIIESADGDVAELGRSREAEQSVLDVVDGPAQDRLEAMLMEGLERSESTPMTRKDWEEIRAEGLRRMMERRAGRQ